MERQAGSAVPPSRLERADLRGVKPAQPIGLQTRHLEALVAVAAEGSFSGAARRLGYTPSAVSQQIAALERIVGQRLIDRSATDGARLTHAGVLLHAHAESIIASIYAAEADLIAAREESAFRIGAVRTVAARLFPAALRRFRRRYPDKPLELLERASSTELLEFVECGVVDAAFVSAPATNGRHLDVRPVLDDAYVLAVPADSDIARQRPPIALREVRSLPVIGFDAEIASGTADGADGWPWPIHLPHADSRTLTALVRAGLGTALVPAFAIADDTAITAIPVADDLPRLEIALVTNGRRSRESLAWLDGIAADVEAQTTPRLRAAGEAVSIARRRTVGAGLSNLFAAVRARAPWPRLHVQPLAFAPAAACVALAAAIVVAQPRPEPTAPAPPTRHAVQRAAAPVTTEVASSGRWVVGSGRA
jgi:DNA-binding transcriptional LysR family regulator